MGDHAAWPYVAVCGFFVYNVVSSDYYSYYRFICDCFASDLWERGCASELGGLPFSGEGMRTSQRGLVGLKDPFLFPNMELQSLKACPGPRNNKHEFSPDGERWYTPQYYHTHLGGPHVWGCQK